MIMENEKPLSEMTKDELERLSKSCASWASSLPQGLNDWLLDRRAACESELADKLRTAFLIKREQKREQKRAFGVDEITPGHAPRCGCCDCWRPEPSEAEKL